VLAAAFLFWSHCNDTIEVSRNVRRATSSGGVVHTHRSTRY